MTKPAPLKHRVCRSSIQTLGEHLRAEDPRFPLAPFRAQALDGLEPLELKDRIAHVADALAAHLPADFRRAAVTIRAANARRRGALEAAPSAPDPAAPDDDLGGAFFALWPVSTYVERHGLQHPAQALETMHGLTALASCEFAIRPFIAADLALVYAQLERWARDPDPHVRRLVSEGTRPRLPWGGRLRALQSDPGPSLPLLDRLHDDPSLYVRRSVANHLNDISKDHPDLAVEIARRWQGRGPSPEVAWVVRHALRGLVKQGHAGALALQGFGEPKLRRSSFEVGPPVLRFGDALELTLELEARGAQDLMIDYAIHHQKANGTLSPKVFKWTRKRVAKGELLRLDKRHPFRPISTRRYHDGLHRAELLINGQSVASVDFELHGVP